MNTKQCSTCGETDPAKFGKDKHRPDGLTTYCKACRAARHKRTYIPTPRRKPAKERDASAYYRQWRKDHREAVNAYHRWYYRTHGPFVGKAR